jgi:hypothetical protein
MRGAPLDHEHLDAMSQVGAGIALAAGAVPADAAVAAAALCNFDNSLDFSFQAASVIGTVSRP